ncbi:MAG: glycosyltransferase [bacterium]
MKVEIFTNNFLPRISGVAVAVNFLNTALNKAGHQTMIVAPDYGYGRRIRGIEVFRVRSLYLKPKRVAMPFANVDEPAIREVTDNWAPDLIHSHHPFGLGNAALEMADSRQVPLVYTFHTLYDFFAHYLFLDTEKVRKAVRDYVVRYANRCDLVITPTEPIKEHLRKEGVTTRIEAVPTGIDFSRFQKVKDEQVEEFRKEHGLTRFDKVLLNVGRISREKNVYLALSALKELTERGKNYCLLFVGDGPEKDGLADQAEEWGISDRLIWGGFLDQDSLAGAYFAGDVFLFPSMSDTQGIVLYEAEAAGLPIVATDSMASRAELREGENGLFAENDPHDFADKIEEVLSSPEDYTADFDTDAFSAEELGRTYDRLYREVLARGRQPEPEDNTIFSRLLDEIKELI